MVVVKPPVHDVLRRQVLDEARGLGEGTAEGAVADRHAQPSPGQRHVGQPPLLAHVGVVGREQARLPSRQEHVVELQPLARTATSAPAAPRRRGTCRQAAAAPAGSRDWCALFEPGTLLMTTLTQAGPIGQPRGLLV